MQIKLIKLRNKNKKAWNNDNTSLDLQGKSIPKSHN